MKNSMFPQRAAGALLVLLLGACSDSGSMFPLNPAAQAIGSPKFEFVRQGIDRGPLTLTMPNGEVLQGRYQVARNGSIGVGFGSFSSYGSHPVFGTTNATTVGVGGGTVFASATGPKTTINCQLTIDLGGHGGGMCATPQDAQWQVIF